MSRIRLMACAAGAVLLAVIAYLTSYAGVIALPVFYMLACAAGAVLLLASPALAQTAPVAVEIPSEDQAEIGVFGFDLNGMDTSVRPGTDFNRYANGNWLANTPIPADKASYGMFTVLRDRSDANLRAIIEESAAKPPSTPSAPRRCRPIWPRSAPPTPARNSPP